MSTSRDWIANPDYALCGVVGLVTLASVCMNVKARINSLPGKKLKQVSAPPTPWLDQKQFHVLSAIIDAFIPSYSLSEVTDDQIRAMIESFGIHDTIPNAPISVENLAKHRAFLCTGALDYKTHHHVACAMDKNLSISEKDKIKGLLGVLGTSLGALVLTGYPTPFQELPLPLREKVLLSWRDHSLEQIRSIFQLFKRAVSVMYMASLNHHQTPPGDNPIWKDIGYDPDAARVNVNMTLEELQNDAILRAQINVDFVLKQLQATKNASTGYHEVDIDAVVVGSGCGGGVVAYNLIKAGFNVLLLDKEGYYNKQEFQSWREIDALDKTFDKAGLMSTEDANFAIFAGSCVGGGSVINWSASFATPDNVLQDWYTETGIEAFNPANTESDYAKAMREVHALFQINTDNSYRAHDEKEEETHCAQTDENHCQESSQFVMNENNRLLWRLAEANGYTPEPIPRNVKDCVDCGHCCYGCSHGRKNTTPHLIYEPLLLAQHKDNNPPHHGRVGRLYVIPFCHVDEVLTENQPSRDTQGNTVSQKKAIGVKAHVKRSQETIPSEQLLLQVRAKVTVVCAGAIQTPALLLRSRFQHPGIGRGLCLHPVVPVCGLMTNDVDTGLSRGVSMGVVVRNPPIFDARTGSVGHAVALETPPAHTAITSTVMPWQGALAFKMMMLSYRQAAVFIGISRDRSSPQNRVVIDAQGAAVVHYRMNPLDSRMVLQGMATMLKFFVADPRTSAMMIGHSSFPAFVRHAQESKVEEAKRLEAYIAAMEKEGIQPMRMQMYSAHQISSVRMASSVENGPVNPRGQLFECDNLFVADGSVLPTALGINPMLTIDCFAQMISRNIVETLNTQK